MKEQKERKLITVGLAPKTSAKQAVPGSLDDMMSGGQLSPELVFLATIKIIDASRLEGSSGGGYSVQLDARFGPSGIYDSIAGMFGNQDNALDAVERQVRAVCLEASEQGMGPE